MKMKFIGKLVECEKDLDKTVLKEWGRLCGRFKSHNGNGGLMLKKLYLLDLTQKR